MKTCLNGAYQSTHRRYACGLKRQEGCVRASASGGNPEQLIVLPGSCFVLTFVITFLPSFITLVYS